MRRLLDARGLDEEPRWTSRLMQMRDTSFAHDLEVNDAAIALRRAIGANGQLEMLEWLDDQQLRRLKGLKQCDLGAITPDGLCLVAGLTGGRELITPVFVEVDRGTETVIAGKLGARDWGTKISGYSQYCVGSYRLDRLWHYLGFSQAEVRTFAPPRVLTITPTLQRLERMLAVTADEQGRGTYLYATKDDVYSSWNAILGPIWRSTVSGSVALNRLLGG